MADYAGAVAAIEQRLIDNWSSAPILLQNHTPPEPWPPLGANGGPGAWVYLEVIGNGSALRSAGLPGSHLWLYEGHILAHVFVPIGSGTEIAHAYAVAIGEVYRAQSFYRDESAGAEIRTWAPRTDGGGSAADDGNYYRVTCTVPFQFFYRG